MGNQFSCTASVLRRALETAARAVERRTVIPILSMALFRVSDGAVTIAGTNLDCEILAKVEGEASGDFAFTIAPRMLTSILREVPNGTQINVKRDGDLVIFDADGLTAKLREICPPPDWPTLVEGVQIGKDMTVGEAQLRETLAVVAPFISTEESRYYLNGVYMHDIGSGLISVATDGRVIGKFQSGITWGMPAAIWPSRTVAQLLRLLSAKGNGEVVLRAFGVGKAPKFKIEAADWSIFFKTIDGTYPNYNRVIPDHTATTTATITASSVRRLPHFGDHSAQAVTLDSGAGQMSIQNANAGFEVVQPMQAIGANLRIGLDARFLRKLASRSPVMRLEMLGSGDPVRVLDDDPRLLRVVMPMRI